MIDAEPSFAANELHAVIERLASETDKADSRHAEATAKLQFELFMVERANVQAVLNDMPPDEELLRQRRAIIASIELENERLESVIRRNNQERIQAERQLNAILNSDPSNQFTV